MQEAPPLVTVVVPCYNHGRYLGDVLTSIEKSTYPYIEVVLINDGSTDGETNTIFNELEGSTVRGRKIIAIDQENQGLSATRNKGIAVATGEFILPLDADDMIDPTFIEKCVWVLTKYPEISIVYPSVQYFGARHERWNARPFNFPALLTDNYMIATSLYRKSMWEEIGGYDQELNAYEDWDFWIRAGASGHRGYWLPEYLFFYRKASTSMLVEANKRRNALIAQLRIKNQAIFDTYGGYTNGKRPLQMLRGRLSDIRWRMFSRYLAIAGRIPVPVKQRFRKYLKPIVKIAFGHDDSVEGGNVHGENLLLDYRYVCNEVYVTAMQSRTQEACNRKQCLFIVPWLEVGGADKVNLLLAEGLPGLGWDVHIFTTLHSDHPWQSMFQNETPHLTHLAKWFREPRELLDYVLDYVQAYNIGIIQVSNSELGYRISSQLKQYCPKVALVDLNHMEEPYNPFDYFRFSERYRFNFDRRIVITDFLKQRMISEYGESSQRVEVIPNGVSVPVNYAETEYEQKNLRNECVILFVGRMEEQKQPLTVVKTAKALCDKYKRQVKFMMVGDGTLFPQAKALAIKMGVSAIIEFLGNQNDVLDIMRRDAHFLIAPSIREGLPIVGLEAMAEGLPIVATEVPGWTELVQSGENGYLVPFDDIHALSDACLRLARDPELRLQMSRNAFDRAIERYSATNTVISYDLLYTAIKSGTER